VEIRLAKIGSNSLSVDELIVFASSRHFQGRSCPIAGSSQFSLSLPSGYKRTHEGNAAKRTKMRGERVTLMTIV